MYRIIQQRKIFLVLSGALFVASLIFIAIWGLRSGIDFTGGSLLELKFQKERPVISEVQSFAAESGLQGNVIVQPIGERNMILRFQETEEDVHQKVLAKFREKYPNNVQEERFESIGPAVGKELRTKAIYSIIVVCVAIVLYVAWAFRKVSWPVESWKYGLIAVIALIHDVTITTGFFAVLGKFFSVEVDMPFVAALLTILGYSVNDTIVIFDRVRENLGRLSKVEFEEVVNRSLNETMARSINTTLTTILAIAAVLFFGGESIRFFALALTVGIFLGAYSSIFVASPLLVVWERWKK